MKTEREGKLAEFLTKMRARELSCVKGPSKGSTLTFYATPDSRVFIIQHHANDCGWEIYLSPNDCRINETLEKAEKVLLESK